LSRTFIFYFLSNEQIGFGHFSRCLSIAEEVHCLEPDSAIYFYTDTPLELQKKWIRLNIINSHPVDNVLSEIKDKAPDVVVLDLKEIPKQLVDGIKGTGSKLVIIDNASKIVEKADIAVFPYLYEPPELKRIPRHVTVLHGPEYVLLNPNIIKKGGKPLFDVNSNRVVVTFGGSDPNDMLGHFIDYLARLPKFDFTVLMGKNYKFKSEIRDICSECNHIEAHEFNWKIVDTLGPWKFVICGFGVSVFEFLYLGIPPVVINRYIDDDIKYANELEQKGLLVSLGYYKNLDFTTFKRRFEGIANRNDFIKKISSNGVELIDGKGAKRVSQIVVGGR